MRDASPVGGEALAGQVSERRGLMEHAGLMAFTQEMLKETDPPSFVQAARQTHDRSGSAPFTLPAHTNLAMSPIIKLYVLFNLF